VSSAPDEASHLAISSDPRLYPSNAPTSVPCRTRAALTTTAWSAHADLTLNDWIRQGRWLGALGRATGWWIGDWIRNGSARYGDRYAAAARVTGYDVQSLMNMAYVAGRFDAPRRRVALSFSHHAELAALPLDDQELWLDRAETSRLSVRSLRSARRHSRERAAARAALPDVRRARNPTAKPYLVCPECGHEFRSFPRQAEADQRGLQALRLPKRRPSRARDSAAADGG
jgi:hypothetical protein